MDGGGVIIRKYLYKLAFAMSCYLNESFRQQRGHFFHFGPFIHLFLLITPLNATQGSSRLTQVISACFKSKYKIKYKTK